MRRRRLPRQLEGKPIIVLVPHKLLTVLGALIAASLITQVALGWVLGVNGAWAAVFIAAALVGVLVTADARLSKPNEAAEAPYDTLLCAIVGIAIVAAVGCLYLPLPWGGIAAAAVVVGLVMALRLSQDHP